MAELKTLKDIERMSFQTKRGIHEDELRKVAQAYIDSLLKNFRDTHGEKAYNILLESLKARDITFYACYSDKAFYIANPDAIDTRSKISWIRHFFNLE